MLPQLAEYSAPVNGERVDLAVTPEYLYADARGRSAELGPIRLTGAAVIKPAADNVDVIAITPRQTIRLRPADLPFPAPKGPGFWVRWEAVSGPN